ncbi:Uma2 family endonuclease [Synechocystis sp. PCC 7509]|uniref:Uma2 family endonuclease n=1 Tax=Synechocystis sp. PCC 7509 TaxID=927677 RepID=UPI0002AC6C41|nr:Uma2 family endonuclease [Synechocystis sp. PCC 7509]
MSSSKTKFSLQEFLTMPESGDRTELIDGEIITKVSPTSPHSRAQKRLLRRLDDWCEQTNLGEVNPEWTVTLKRNSVDWAPVPDLTYISTSRIPADWDGQGPCPGIPELVIEIISPGQSFGGMTGKATDYLLAGVNRIWVVDNQAQSVTVFGGSDFPQTFWINDTLSDVLLPELAIALTDIFAPRRLPNAE